MLTLKQSKKRYYQIMELRKKRFTLREIAEKYKITTQRVQQITTRGEPKTVVRILSKLQNYLQSIGREGREHTREKVRIRDKWTCQDCKLIKKTTDVFKHNSKIKILKGKIKALDIHHLNGKCGKLSKNYDASNDLTDMITLCHKCHYNRPEHKVKSKNFGKKSY